MKKRLLTLLIAMATTLSLTACGSSNYSDVPYSAKSMESVDYAMADAGMAYDYPAAYEEEVYEDSAAVQSNEVSATENATNTNRKLIRTVSLNVETIEFENAVSSLTDMVNTYGGYIENMNSYNGSEYDYSPYRNRSANFTIRIPSEKLDEFINLVGNSCNITTKSESVEDITLKYVDTDSHKKMLIKEREKLTQMLDMAETIEEMITIEDRLTYIDYEIDSMESQLRTFDNQVDYSTLYININEVSVYTPSETTEYTPGQRIALGFVESLQDVCHGLSEFGIGFVINLPYIIVWAVIIAVIILIIRAIIKHNPYWRENIELRAEKRREMKANRKAAKAERKAAKDDKDKSN